MSQWRDHPLADRSRRSWGIDTGRGLKITVNYTISVWIPPETRDNRYTGVHRGNVSCIIPYCCPSNLCVDQDPIGVSVCLLPLHISFDISQTFSLLLLHSLSQRHRICENSILETLFLFSPFHTHPSEWFNRMLARLFMNNYRHSC